MCYSSIMSATEYIKKQMATENTESTDKNKETLINFLFVIPEQYVGRVSAA